MSKETTSSAADKNNQQGVRLPFGRYALFFALAIIGVLLDLFTKTYMFTNYFEPAMIDQPQQAHWLIEGVFGFQCSTNPGALFGIGKGLSWLFATLSFVALAGIMTWLFVFGAAWDRWITVALGLISGGILGNLYDRLGFGFCPGYPESIRTNVRDWILFRLEGVPMFDPWPNFNIADSLLVCGAIMLLGHAIIVGDPKSPPTTESETESNE